MKFIEIRKYNKLYACAINEFAIKCLINHEKDSLNNSKLQLRFTNSDDNFICCLDVDNEVKNEIMKKIFNFQPKSVDFDLLNDNTNRTN